MDVADNAGGRSRSPRVDHALMVADVRAFRHLHDVSRAYLLAYAMRITRNRDMAEDVIQESMATIWASVGSYAWQRAAPMTWMCTIVRNKAIDSLRRDGEHWAMALSDDLAFDAAPEPGASPQEACEQRQVHEAIMRCIASLCLGQRRALELVYCRDLSHPEAALVLCQPLGTVKTLVRRGLFNVRAGLGTAAGAPGRSSRAAMLPPLDNSLSNLSSPR